MTIRLPTGNGEDGAEQPAAQGDGIKVGDVIGGDIRIDAEVGRGGMGVVFLGWQLGLKRKVAVKVLNLHAAEDPAEAIERFEREGYVLGSVGKNPAITDVYASGIHKGLPYLVMEWAEGKSLDKVVEEEGPLGETRALRVVEHICDALITAHAGGLIHRDLKTDNVILVAGDAVRLLDFGIARLFRPSADDPRRKKTATGTIIGTPRCMSPEQAGGQELDHRTDLYSLGVILYELLTGHRPFDDQFSVDSDGNQVRLTPGQVTVRIASGEAATKVKVFRPDVSEPVAALVDKAMAFAKAARFQSAQEFKFEIVDLIKPSRVPQAKSTDPTMQVADAYRQPPTLAAVARTPQPSAPAPKRRLGRLALVFAGVLALVGAGFAGALIATARRAQRSAPTAAIPVAPANPTTTAPPPVAPPAASPPPASPSTTAPPPTVAATVTKRTPPRKPSHSKKTIAPAVDIDAPPQ